MNLTGKEIYNNPESTGVYCSLCGREIKRSLEIENPYFEEEIARRVHINCYRKNRDNQK